MINISTVTPVYSGQDYLEQLVKQLREVRNLLETHSKQLRIAESIFVLDGPVDSSEAILRELEKQNDWIKIVPLSRNFGQHNATVAGILHSSGDWIVTLDEDLQHPPGKILELLLEAVRKQADVVLVIPARGSHKGSYRDKSSRLSKKLIGLLSKSEFITLFSSFRLIRGQVARAAASVCSHQTYFDTALVWFTSRIISVPLELQDVRFAHQKTSGYSFFSLLSHAKRLVISSDIKFLNFSIMISIFSMLVAVILESWVVFNYFFNPEVSGAQGWASQISVTIFYGGIFSLLLGFVLEIVKANMFQGQGKPTFFIVDRNTDDFLRRELEAVLEHQA